MKNLIYQYWDGPLLQGCRAGVANMKEYAERIGVEYLFEHNPKFVTNLGSYSPHFGAFKPIYTDDFYKYDNVLFLDTDVFAVDRLTENIFEYFETFNAEIGICTEPLQPQLRSSSTTGIARKEFEELWAETIKDKWNVDLPRTEDNLLKVYNSGVVIYSNKGMQKAKEKFPPFKEYVTMIQAKKLHPFYTCDQFYLHAMLSVCNFNYVEMDNEWNRFITFAGHGKQNPKTICDPRTENTKFVHIQMRGADHYDASQHWRITNCPIEEWGVDRGGSPFIRGNCLTGEPI